ncbi:MAG: hypothetical protein V2J42_03875 [Wenzhouxiangella sp.]|jgi:hypothetical protein|nr:hypothetical protein [Wenzhouxiangella sp.]
MIDTRKNLLTAMLASLIGLMLVVGLALFVLLGRVDVARIAPEGETSVPGVAVVSPESGLEAFDEYSEIYRRPVFFSDRRLPVIALADLEEEEPEIEEEFEEEEPIPDLNASVAGIIITPEMRMAMIRDQEAGRTMLLREGMSLEGEQAAWKLDRIDSRLVNFVSVDGRSAGLELEVNTRGLTRPTRTRETTAEEASADETPEAETAEQSDASQEALSRAEEIRRRVAERRAELRAEAERRAQQQQENP